MFTWSALRYNDWNVKGRTLVVGFYDSLLSKKMYVSKHHWLMNLKSISSFFHTFFMFAIFLQNWNVLMTLLTVERKFPQQKNALSQWTIKF